MNILISGSSGLVGSRIIQTLTADGHVAIPLVRRQPTDGTQRFWNPDEGVLDPQVFDGIDGVIHLGGVNIAERRWSEKQKQRIRDSRVDSTTLLAKTMAALDRKPSVFVCASAIGYYGDRGDEELTEQSPAGEGYLPEICDAWERSTLPAVEAGIRVVNIRSGMVLAREDGALAKMLLPFKLGAGGVMGSGNQFWSWISIEDAARAYEFAVTCEELRGPVNGVSPDPVTNRTFTKCLGKVIHRPTIIPMPAFAARLAFGELADGLMLASANVIPTKLQAAGFEYRHPTIDAALTAILGS